MRHPNSKSGSTRPVQRYEEEPPEPVAPVSKSRRISWETAARIGVLLGVVVVGGYLLSKVRTMTDQQHADVAKVMQGPSGDVEEDWRTNPEQAYVDFCRRSLTEKLEIEKAGALNGEDLQGFNSTQYALAVKDYDAFNLYVRRCTSEAAARLRVNAEMRQGEDSLARGDAEKARFHFAMALADIEPLLTPLPDTTKEDRGLRQWLLHLQAYCETKLGQTAAAKKHFYQAESVTPDAPDRRLAMHRKNWADVSQNRSSSEELRVGAYRNLQSAETYVRQRDVLRKEFPGRQQAQLPQGQLIRP